MTDGDYEPIEDYGLIGNTETAALVSREGSIDWACFPTMNASSVFGAILDSEQGGRFAIRPTADYESSQEYLDRTNVLRTTFRTESGVATITDFMPLLGNTGGNAPTYRAIYRKVECIEGTVELGVEFAPRFDYARAETSVEPTEEGALASSDAERVLLSVPDSTALDVEGEGKSNGGGENTASATHTLQTGESGWYVCQYGMRAPTDPTGCQGLLDRTAEYWRDWAHDCDREDCPFAGSGHDLVVRAGLLIKLLTYKDTGAIAAAPTTSLPEVIGGVRNWDYRYSWIRDGALTVRAFDNLGHEREARRYLNRFLDLSRSIDPAELRPLYGLEHSAEFEERELDSLEGYENSKPVRIGNAASSQMQLGMYGEMVNAIAHLAESEDGVAAQDWEAITEVIEYVRENWAEKGAGIWEQRGDPKHWVHSKMMCWVAIDRALELADREGFDAPDEEWRETAAEIKETTIERGFDEELNAFTQSFRNEQMDASVLLGLLAGFPADDDHLTGTIDAVENRLMPDGPEEGLVYRYEDDGLPGDEGAFVICSFWLVGCLARAGRIERAREVFEAMQAYTSPLGLVAEELDPESGRLLGNYPQAFSHIGFVNSALYLAEAEHGESIEPFDGGSAE
jgi:GH15 family glucan-1,4-alpha-glucosidase